MSFCAVCIAPIEGEPNREPLGRDDALVDVCDRCAKDEVVPREHITPHQLRERQDSDDRAAQIRRHRESLAARGICTNGEKHGPATHGRLCTACHEKWGSGRKKPAEAA